MMEEEVYNKSGQITKEPLPLNGNSYQYQPNIFMPNQLNSLQDYNSYSNSCNNQGNVNQNYPFKKDNNDTQVGQEEPKKQQYSLQDDLMHYLCIKGQKKSGTQSIDSNYLNLIQSEIKKQSEGQSLQIQDVSGMTPMQYALEQQQNQMPAISDQSAINYYKKMQEFISNSEPSITKLQIDFQNNQQLWNEECRKIEDKPSLNNYQILQEQQQQSLRQQQSLLSSKLQYFSCLDEFIQTGQETASIQQVTNSILQSNKQEAEGQQTATPINNISESNFQSPSFMRKLNTQNQNDMRGDKKYQQMINQIQQIGQVNFMDEEQIIQIGVNNTQLNYQDESFIDKEQANRNDPQSLQQISDYCKETQKLDQKKEIHNQKTANNENAMEQENYELNIEDGEKKEEEEDDDNNQLGSLSFEEFAFSENAFKLDEQKEENRLRVSYKLHPTLKPVEAFLINGEIIVSFDLFYSRKNQEHDKVSLWNMFRPINTVTIKRTIVEVSMHKSQNTLSNFQPLIQRLIDMHDQQAYASAQMLQQHFLSLQSEQQIKQQVLDDYGQHISHLQWQLDENFHKSKQIAYDMMDQLPEDAFFLYSIRRTDPVTLDSIFCALGYSKGLIRLIAGNEQNYQQFCLRSGLAEIFNAQSRLQILLMNLLLNNKVQITITTLDDITIPIEMRVHYQKLMSTEILPGVFKEDYMKIYQILVDQKYLDEIYQIRGFSATGQGSGSNDPRIIQTDYSYQMQSHQFVERFYPETLKEKNNAIKKASATDQRNFTAEFQRIFGNQNEGNNYLNNVFNTTIKQNSNQNIQQSSSSSISAHSPSHNKNIKQSDNIQQNQYENIQNPLNASTEIRQKQETSASCSIDQSLISSSSSQSRISSGVSKNQRKSNKINKKKEDLINSLSSSSHSSRNKQRDPTQTSLTPS